MNICEIGNNFFKTHNISYLSERTFLDFDAIVIDLQFMLTDFDGRDDTFYLKRKKQLEEFLHHKKTPIIYLNPVPGKITFYRNNRSNEYNYDYLVPVPNFSLERELGKNFHVTLKTPFTDFLNKYKEYFDYRFYFNEKPGIVIAETTHTNKVLAFCNEQCVFLPNLSNLTQEAEAEFLVDLINCVNNIRTENAIVSLPAWSEKYLLPKEEQVRGEIISIQNEIDILTKKLVAKESEVETLLLKKKLFTSTGKNLEKEVESIFRDLNLEILEVDGNRDDFIIKYGEKVAVVEVKGVNGSAAERHAAQLEKWAAIYLEKTGITPKAILLVNTFREKQLKDRTEPSFPNQMIGYSTKREHCLLTTLQLLGIHYEVIKNPNSKDELIHSLFDTVGEYKGFKDWQEFIVSPK